MWKYVSRRVKDVYDKTYNVIDLRRNRFVGQIEGFSSSPSSFARNSKHDDQLIRNSSLVVKSSSTGNSELCFLYLHNRHGSHSKSSSSSSSRGREDFHKKDYHTYARLQNTWLGALTWSSAIVCGWYASQLLCLHRRHLGWDTKTRCLPSKILFSSSRALHTNVLSHRAFSAPETRLNQHVYQRSALLKRIGDENVMGHGIYQISNDYNNFGSKSADVNPSQSSSTTPPSSPTTPSSTASTNVDGAYDNLMRVLGEIEYQMGIQNLAIENYSTAVSHLKLATSHHHPAATFNLALCYEQGVGVDKDLQMAGECYKIASSLGHAKAIYNLGVYYARGLGGLPKDKNEAKRHFVIAAELGQKDAKVALAKENQSKYKSIATRMDIGPNKSTSPSIQLHRVAISAKINV